MDGNMNVNGMKEVNKKLAQRAESMDSIARSLQKIEKILNRQVPKPAVPSQDAYVAAEREWEEDDEDDMP